jgi:tetratricopeptide (TPR) repeat protein
MVPLARHLLNVMGVLFIAGCVTAGPKPGENDMDQLPMYGGIDRGADPRLRAQDEKFIAKLTQEFGSRLTASRVFVEQGFDYQHADNYAMAMTRFNQAWLIDPGNPDAFWGFAMVYDAQGKPCQAKAMIDMALARNLSKPVALADAGRIYTLCAVGDDALRPAEKRRYFERSEELYSRAVSMAPTQGYIFGSWAAAHYWRGGYADAWKMVKKQRALGGTPEESFLNLLRAKMPEPR